MNRVFIEPIKFTELRSGEESYGWRAFDDYSQTCDAGWGKADLPEDDSKFLERVLATSEDAVLWAMIDFCSDFRQGIHVGERFIDWQKLSPLLGFDHDPNTHSN